MEDWLDDVISCGVWIANTVQQEGSCLVLKVMVRNEDTDEIPDIPTSQATLDKFSTIQKIQALLEELCLPDDLSQKQQATFLRQASRFFIKEGKFCWKNDSG